jgi:hypothetical protein
MGRPLPVPVGLGADAIAFSACAIAYAVSFSTATSTSISAVSRVSGGAIAEATLTAVADAASVAHDEITTSLEASVSLLTALGPFADAAKARIVSMKTSMAFLNRRERAGVQASEQLNNYKTAHRCTESDKIRCTLIV